MSKYLLIYFMKIVLFIVLFLTMYFTVLFFREKYLDNKIKKGMNDIDDKAVKKQAKEFQYISKRHSVRYFEELTTLIEQSGITTKFKFVNSIFVFTLSLILAFIFFSLSEKFINVLVPSIIIAIIGYKIPSITLNIMAAINTSKTTKKLVDLINLLRNFCMIKNDIVYAISSSTTYLAEPLRSICDRFSIEVKHGVSPYDALENMKGKIDSNQYKLLLKNLQLCSKHSNEYLKVLKKSEEMILKFSKEQNLRNKEIKKGIIGICMLVAVSVIIFFLLMYLNPNLPTLLVTSTFGKFIISTIVFGYLVAILVCEKLSKFDS